MEEERCDKVTKGKKVVRVYFFRAFLRRQRERDPGGGGGKTELGVREANSGSRSKRSEFVLRGGLQHST